ncbi:MarC family protein [Candidatus Bathyarchaeota archaeon]|nr:MarC family protein [Candidatus Bathyarchaeota archaeon]
MFDIIVENGISLATAILTLFVIVNPLGNIPLFVSLTNKMNENQRKNVFNTASIVAFVLLLIFAFTGQEVFSVFGISIYSFQISGGILLLIIAIRIIVSGRVLDLDDSPESVGVVPIAMPLLVGPGAITTTIFNVQTY